MEHGGLFLYVDETGIYAPEMERVEMLDEEAEEGKEVYEIHRVTLEPCTFIDGVLSDNPYHPKHAAWFADDIEAVAECVGFEDGADGLRRALCSEDPQERAWAWCAVLDYHGWINGDNYPRTLTRAEAEARYAKELASGL